MADEKLVLVERFEELRTGMRVVVKRYYGGKNSGVLGRREQKVASYVTGGITVLECFTVVGSKLTNGLPLAVSALCVGERIVFRYAADLDMERELAAETARDKPYVGPVVAAAMRMGLLPQ